MQGPNANDFASQWNIGFRLVGSAACVMLSGCFILELS